MEAISQPDFQQHEKGRCTAASSTAAINYDPSQVRHMFLKYRRVGRPEAKTMQLPIEESY